jgi:hypothetical protein
VNEEEQEQQWSDNVLSKNAPPPMLMITITQEERDQRECSNNVTDDLQIHLDEQNFVTWSEQQHLLFCDTQHLSLNCSAERYDINADEATFSDGIQNLQSSNILDDENSFGNDISSSNSSSIGSSAVEMFDVMSFADGSIDSLCDPSEHD